MLDFRARAGSDRDGRGASGASLGWKNASAPSPFALLGSLGMSAMKNLPGLLTRSDQSGRLLAGIEKRYGRGA